MSAEPYPFFLPDLWEEMTSCADSAPLTPSKIRRFFLLLLRAHWSDAGNYGPDLEDTLRCLTWSPDQTRLGIELQGAKNPPNLQHMIWVAVGNFQARQISFGNRSGYEEDNATERYVLPCAADLLIRHDAPSLDLAMDMAWSTFCFLLGFQESILDALGGEGAGFSPRMLAEPRFEEPGPKDRFRVDVGAVLSVNVAVATTVESHRLNRIALTTSTITQ